MRIKNFGTAALMMAVAGTAFGQSFNIDFNGSGRAAPASSHGAASAQAGQWTSVVPSSAETETLLNLLDGSAAKVSFRHAATHGGKVWTYGAGEFAKLMDDVAWTETRQGEIEAEIRGLEPGSYRFWIYAGFAPGFSGYQNGANMAAYHNGISLYLDGDLQSTQYTSGISVNGQYLEGTNYVRFNVAVPSGVHTVKVRLFGADNVDHARAALAGIQVTRLSDTLYVAPGGAGNRNGQSWANAMDNLQEAINVANASGGAYTRVWVKGGVYKPTNTTDRTASFTLKNNVEVYGGFAGTEIALSQRVLGAHASILSGDIGTGRVNTDNSYHVVRADNTTRTAVLDGFSIVSGNANGVGDHEDGGGILGSTCSATFRNLYLASNSAKWMGGGIAINSPNVLVGPVIDRCEFYQNSVAEGSGGGLFYVGQTSGSFIPSLMVVNSTFTRNTCENFGGGAYVGTTWSSFTNCVFNGNSAPDGSGGGLFAGDGSPAVPAVRVVNCTFAHNTALGTGGFDSQNVKPELYNSILWGNTGTVGSVRHQNFSFTNDTFDIDYNVIQGYQQNEWLGTGNLNADPLFVDANGANNILGDFDDNLRLQDTSPAIDAASNTLRATDWVDIDADGSYAEAMPIDLAMNPRTVDGPMADTGAGQAPLIDMGAFENQNPPAPACPVDFNGDGFLDFFDYDDYVTCFEGGSCPAGKTPDFNGDAFVDFFDYDDFVTAFEAGC